MSDAATDMASQKSPLLLRKTSMASRGKRRRSKLLSWGRWDWAYDDAPPSSQFDPQPPHFGANYRILLWVITGFAAEDRYSYDRLLEGVARQSFFNQEGQ